jgi:hypothetical protein
MSFYSRPGYYANPALIGATAVGECVEHPTRKHPPTRRIWELQVGPIPAGLAILHHCDNKRCERLSHLFLGTAADNLADARAKDRWRPGKTFGPKSDITRARISAGKMGHPWTEAQRASISAGLKRYHARKWKGEV